MYNCPNCGKEFLDKKKLNNHIKWHKGFEKYNIQKSKEKTLQDEASRLERKFICERCNSEFIKILSNKEYKIFLKTHKHFYCSRSCANARKHSKKTKQKISNKLKKINLKRKRTCKVCKLEYSYIKGSSTKSFCSQKCYNYYKLHRCEFLSEETIQKYRECGRRVAQQFKNNKRSKNEIAFCELCKTKFENVLNNEPMFNGWDADIILPELKIAILWNGKWHYEKITKKHSLEQVQNRDKIKVAEIIKYGYYPYIIKDLGKFSIKKVNEQFEKFNNFLENEFTFI